MRVIGLCSGGKDSTYALWLAMRKGHEIMGLLAMIPRREDSWMFHTANIKLVDLFAECAGMPLLKAETSGEREEELKDLENALQRFGADGVVTGAIASTYQKSRTDRICRNLGLLSIAPLWGKEPLELMREFLTAGFEAIITSVTAEGFDGGWLGRRIDEKCINELVKLNFRYRINICGEGGEYETLVLDAPFFKRKIEVEEAESIWRGSGGYYLIKRAKTVEK